MKTIRIIITAEVPDEATDDELGWIAGTAEVQVMEPVDMEGDDLEWSPTRVYTHTELHWTDENGVDMVRDLA